MAARFYPPEGLVALVLVLGSFFVPSSVLISIFFLAPGHPALAIWASWSVFALWTVGMLIVVRGGTERRRRNVTERSRHS